MCGSHFVSLGDTVISQVLFVSFGHFLLFKSEADEKEKGGDKMCLFVYDSKFSTKKTHRANLWYKIDLLSLCRIFGAYSLWKIKEFSIKVPTPPTQPTPFMETKKIKHGLEMLLRQVLLSSCFFSKPKKNNGKSGRCWP